MDPQIALITQIRAIAFILRNLRKKTMRHTIITLTLPALLAVALAACGPDAYEGTKDAPDTCRLCDDGTVDTAGTDGGTVVNWTPRPRET